MDKNLKREELNALGVHDLRNLARSLGVVGPTMKLKEQLVEDILDIMSGKIQADTTVKRGRKANVNLSYPQVENDIIPNEILKLFQKRQNGINNVNGVLKFNQSTPNFQDLYGEEIGFVVKENNYYCIIVGNGLDVVLINKDIVDKYGLMVGDKVRLSTKKMAFSNVSVARDVLEINNIPSTKFKRNLCRFDNVENNCKNEMFSGLNEGQNATIECQSFNVFFQNFLPFFDYCKKNDIKIVFLAEKLCFGEAKKIEAIADLCECFELNLDDQIEISDVLMNATNHAIALASGGEKVVYIAYDFGKMKTDVVKSILKEENTEYDILDFERFLQEIATIARVLKNKGSVTTIFVNS